nr:hypothetical protein Iba_chr13cCG15070 [Ipomoea batatas]GMD81358.1 hypothetical protein Iba_chr13eCG10850 [Ipomoea batatas]
MQFRGKKDFAYTTKNHHDTFLVMLNKLDEIQKEYETLKAKNCQLKSDNSHATEELKNLDSLTE